MYELIQLTERTYYIKSPTNIGLFRLDEKNVCLIDSGNDKDAGRRIRQASNGNGSCAKTRRSIDVGSCVLPMANL